MPEFKIDKASLESAMKIAMLSTESVDNLITGHCLFDLKGPVLQVLATDKKNRLSRSIIEVPNQDPSLEIKFTADPRTILKLLKNIEMPAIRFSFLPDTATLQVFLSDTEENFLSLSSFQPESYAPINENFDKAYDLRVVKTRIFLKGLQFIKGFLDNKDKRFSNMYITQGIIYGANGSNKAGAYSNPELEGLDELVFPLTTFTAITNMIETLDLKDVLIRTSSNQIFISSLKKDFIFGFTKVQVKMPKMPIITDEPSDPGWSFNRKAALKKLSRLHLTGDAKLGVKFEFTKSSIQITTIADRPSKDQLPCTDIKESCDLSCILECRLLESVLDQFDSENVTFYVSKKAVIYSNTLNEIVEDGIKTVETYVNAAAVSLSRES